MHDLADNGFEDGNRMFLIQLLVDVDRAEMAMEAVRSGIARVWWRSDTDWGGGDSGSEMIKFLKVKMVKYSRGLMLRRSVGVVTCDL